MDLLIGALTIVAVLIALYLVYKSKTESSQEIAAKEVLGKEVSKMENKHLKPQVEDDAKKD